MRRIALAPGFGFTGGTINAVTKSGTNEFHGSASYYKTDDSMAGNRIGDSVRDRTFDEKNYAFTLGGPVIKDKLFFFGAYDKYEESAAFNRGIEGSSAINISDISAADATSISSIAQSVYGLDTGSFSGVPPVEDEKILGSVDWNITNDHRAKFTYMKTEGASIVEQNGNNFVLSADVAFPSSWYNRSETVESFIGHVYSDWTPNFSTELKIAKTTQSTGQDSLLGAETPLVSVATSGDVIAFGPDRFRHGNELDQEFMQYKAKAEYLYGNHTLKAGFEREEVDADNLFAQNSEGTYAYNSISDFQNNLVAGVTYDNAISNDENDLRAIWGYNYNSLYAQDTWDVRDDLSLVFGLRYDWYESEGAVRENTNFENRYGFKNTNDVDGLDVILPRFGFTWDATENVVVRGGVGRFSGGSPSVWISNSYSNDGITNDSVSYYFDGTNVCTSLSRGACSASSIRNDLTQADLALPTSPDAATGQYLPQVALNELAQGNPDGPVNALGPNFEIPTTWKANIGVAYNVDLPYSPDWTFGVDFLYNKLENAPYWYDAACTPNGTAPDGRLTYDCSNGPQAIVVGSTDKGESLLWAVSARKEFDNGIDLFASYTNQDVEDVGMGTSSTATSNYSDTPRFSLQEPTAGISNFQVEHMFKLRLNWEKEFVENYPTKVSLFATRRSGQPYSYTFMENNANLFGTDESSSDDAGHLLYVPSGPSDPLFAATSFGGDAAQQAAFFDYIDSTELAQYKGGIAERNGDNSRWSTIVDMRLQQQFPGALKGHKTFFFVDIENLGNLINDDWGRIERTQYEYERAVVSASIVNGQYQYFNLQSDSRIKNLEILNQSLWQVQLGVKYEF